MTKNQSAEARKKYLPAMTLMDEFGIGTGLAVWEQEGRVPDITWIPDWHVVMEWDLQDDGSRVVKFRSDEADLPKFQQVWKEVSRLAAQGGRA